MPRQKRKEARQLLGGGARGNRGRCEELLKAVSLTGTEPVRQQRRH